MTDEGRRLVSVLVANSKGGCGKTTLATNLATAFANGGLCTALADTDRQHSSLGWLEVRPKDAAPIEGLDWSRKVGKVPGRVQRLVIDGAAGPRHKHVAELVALADLLVVPVLPSMFDARSTRDFLDRLVGIKPIRKGRKAVLVVANRIRPRTRATQRLTAFLGGIDQAPVTLMPDRSIYAELASDGLGLFDIDGSKVRAIREAWLPLVRAIELAGED